VLNNIRVMFSRGNDVKYISHLDMMKLFERAFRRSRIPIAYSQGFNPHPQLVFGLPLSVGVTSEAEYADFELDSEIKPEEFMSVLNRYLPEGIKIIKAAQRKTKANIMASIAAARYKVSLVARPVIEIKEIKDSFSKLLERENLFVNKESKRKVIKVDIRPMIYSLEFLEESVEVGDQETLFCLSMLLSAGSVSNLKPELVLNAYNDFSGRNIEIIKIHRTGLFVCNGDRLADPLEDNSFLAL